MRHKSHRPKHTSCSNLCFLCGLTDRKSIGFEHFVSSLATTIGTQRFFFAAISSDSMNSGLCKLKSASASKPPATTAAEKRGFSVTHEHHRVCAIERNLSLMTVCSCCALPETWRLRRRRCPRRHPLRWRCHRRRRRRWHSASKQPEQR